jgi:nucleoside-diphosphate-sugar epimerase
VVNLDKGDTMKVLVAGATGAVGKRLVPMLVSAGHDVVATTRSQPKAEQLRAQGSRAAIVDGLDRDGLIEAVKRAEPDVIVHQMTALAGLGSNLRRFDRNFAVTNRLRTEGTENMLAAARQAAVPRLVAQSYTGWPNIRAGGMVKAEQDGLDPDPPKAQRKSLQAIKELEQLLTAPSDIEGIVLRCGNLYGPGTGIEHGGALLDLVAKRRFPIIGPGAGVWSFVHIDDAAAVTVAALDHGQSGVFNVVDDEPASVSTWLPYLAQAIGAKPPRRLPI